MSSSLMTVVGKREIDVNIKPECIVSSGCDLKNEEETDDEDMCNNANKKSNSHENHLLPIKAVKAEVKEEDDDISTDDEQFSPDYVISSSGYDPAVKSEETDNEDTSNEQHLPIKEECKEMKTTKVFTLSKQYYST